MILTNYYHLWDTRHHVIMNPASFALNSTLWIASISTHNSKQSFNTLHQTIPYKSPSLFIHSFDPFLSSNNSNNNELSSLTHHPDHHNHVLHFPCIIHWKHMQGRRQKQPKRGLWLLPDFSGSRSSKPFSRHKRPCHNLHKTLLSQRHLNKGQDFSSASPCKRSRHKVHLKNLCRCLLGVDGWPEKFHGCPWV